MDELDCMRTVDEALRSLEGEAARARVVSWLAAKYVGNLPHTDRSTDTRGHVDKPNTDRLGRRANEIPGIGKLSATGELQLTVRDFKASSANDAAVRLVHVAIWAASKLTDSSTISSKHVILPLLRKYRCYDGNTRTALAAEKGIVRDGDSLSLDFHSEQYAEKVVEQILDASIEGKWKPGATRRRTSRSTPAAWGTA